MCGMRSQKFYYSGKGGFLRTSKRRLLHAVRPARRGDSPRAPRLLSDRLSHHLVVFTSIDLNQSKTWVWNRGVLSLLASKPLMTLLMLAAGKAPVPSHLSLANTNLFITCSCPSLLRGPRRSGYTRRPLPRGERARELTTARKHQNQKRYHPFVYVLTKG